MLRCLLICLAGLSAFAWASPAFACQARLPHPVTGLHSVSWGRATIENGDLTFHIAEPVAGVESGKIGVYMMRHSCDPISSSAVLVRDVSPRVRNEVWWEVYDVSFGVTVVLTMVLVGALVVLARRRDLSLGLTTAGVSGVVVASAAIFFVWSNPPWFLDGVDAAERARWKKAGEESRRQDNLWEEEFASRRRVADREPPTEDPCPESSMCRKYGRCTFVDGDCRATSADDCARSEACKTRGRCELINRECSATEAFCARWEGCPDELECAADEAGCVVVPDSCEETEACKKLGHCAYVDDGCRATTDDHCRQSEICREEGACVVGVGPAIGRCITKEEREIARDPEKEVEEALKRYEATGGSGK